MSDDRSNARDGDDRYYWLTSFLAAHGARSTVSRAIAAIVLVLGILQLMLMLTPAGPQGRTSELLSVGAAVGSVVITWCWLRAWWPTSTASKLCCVLGTVCVAVVCLIQTDPLLGMLASTVFTMVNGVTALFHYGRLLVLTSAVSAVTVGVLAARLAQTDVVVGVAGAGIVVVVSAYVVVTSRLAMRMVNAEMGAGEVDPLTGLLSRSAFDDEFAKLMGASSRDDDRHLVVLVINVDSFSAAAGVKGVAGDKWARVALGQRLRETVRGNAILAHVDDADFLIADLFTTPDAAPLAERVHDAIYAAPLRMTASIGAVSTPLRPLSGAAPPDVLDEILRLATAAVEDVQRSGGDGIRQVLSPRLDVLGNANGLP
jgi:GGDEF domain-containing protein